MTADLTGRTSLVVMFNGVEVAHYEPPLTHTDGPFTVTVHWEEKKPPSLHSPGYWVARFYRAITTFDTVHLSTVGIGSTQVGALADLAVALYVALAPEPPTINPEEDAP